MSCLQRQSITPRQFGFPWLRSSLESTSGGSNVSYRMRSVLAASSLEQASRLFLNDLTWQSAIGRLKFQHLAGSIERALSNKIITPTVPLIIFVDKSICCFDLSTYCNLSIGGIGTNEEEGEKSPFCFNSCTERLKSLAGLRQRPCSDGLCTCRREFYFLHRGTEGLLLHDAHVSCSCLFRRHRTNHLRRAAKCCTPSFKGPSCENAVNCLANL